MYKKTQELVQGIKQAGYINTAIPPPSSNDVRQFTNELNSNSIMDLCYISQTTS